MFAKKDLEKMTAANLKSLAHTYGLNTTGRTRKDNIKAIDEFITESKMYEPKKEPEKKVVPVNISGVNNVDANIRKDLEKRTGNDLVELSQKFDIDVNGITRKDYIDAIGKYMTENKKNEEKKINTKPKQKITCASPQMTSLKFHKACNDDKICNVDDGKCISNSNANKKNKSLLLINDKIYVGSNENVNKLEKIVNKEFSKCDVLSFLSKYGYFVNRMILFLYPTLSPGNCLVTKNNMTKIDSRCRTTADSIIYALTGDNFDKFNLIDKKDLTFYTIMEKLLVSNMLVISISSTNNFAGHIFIIIKSGDIYYIIQSYIYEYAIDITVATDTQIMLYITKYLDIFNNKKWRPKDTKSWKCLTGVYIPVYNDIKPDLFIYWSPTKYTLDTDNCQGHIKQIIKDALNKIDAIKDGPSSTTPIDLYIYKRDKDYLKDTFSDIMALIDQDSDTSDSDTSDNTDDSNNYYDPAIYYDVDNFYNTDSESTIEEENKKEKISNPMYKLASYIKALFGQLQITRETNYNHLDEDGCLQINPIQHSIF